MLMSFKQKVKTMKYFILPSILILFLNSCITSTSIQYSDPNYLQSSEFSSYEDLAKNNDMVESYNENTVDSTYNYNEDYYYDYSFSSRIRRFHRPIYHAGYFGGIYTDYYWYNNDPFYCGTNIYYGYNWPSAYYPFYSYSPYYHDYYMPYYYSNYYALSGYHHHFAINNNYYTNRKNHNSYIDGRRGSLLSKSNTRGIKVNRNSKILSNSNKYTNLNIRRENTESKTTKRRNYNSISQTNTVNERNKSIKNNTNSNHSKNTTIRKNSNNRKNSYSKYQNTNRNYKYNSRPNKSNTMKRNSSNRGRSIKPRK